MPSKSFEVRVEPAVLKWARDSAGWTAEEVGEKLDKNHRLIESWESGDKSPTINQLRFLANCYKRPLAALLLPRPPEELPLPHDFRNLQGRTASRLSPKIMLVMRRARRLQSIAKELKEEPLIEAAQRIGHATVNDDPELVAQKIRGLLGIDIQTQLEWEDNKEALDQWIYSIEALGILVFQMSMPIEDARAFSLLDNELPVIVINTRDFSLNAKIFSLFHELGHILLNKDGICDPGGYPESSANAKSTEVFCNQFAGAVLIPMNRLLNDNRVRDIKGIHDWQDRTLGSLSKDFKVSKEVVLRRLLLARLTSNEFYDSKRKVWMTSDEKRQNKGHGGKGGRDYPKECIHQVGVPLVSLILNSYRDKKITKSDVADYLEISLKYLPDIERNLEA